jgi:superfamily II DNA or RNA helicase
VQYAGRILRPFPGKTTAEVHDYHDVATNVLASSLANARRVTRAWAFPILDE